MQTIDIKSPQDYITYNNKQYDTNPTYNFSDRKVTCIEKTIPYVIASGAILCGYIAGLGASSTNFNPATSYSNSTLVVNSLDCFSEHSSSSIISSAVAGVTTILSYHLLNYCANLKSNTTSNKH